MLPIDDRVAIHELLNLHGHICDAGAFDRFEDIMTDDVTYDVSDLGGDIMHGLEELRAASVALGAGNPIAHLVTNVVIGEVTSDGVQVVSKGLGLMASGEIGSVVYCDRVIPTTEGWRIARRQVIARREPLSPYDVPDVRSGPPRFPEGAREAPAQSRDR